MFIHNNHIKFWRNLILLISCILFSSTGSILAKVQSKTSIFAENTPTEVIVVQESKTFIKTPVVETRSANDLGWACMAASSLVSNSLIGSREKLELLTDRLSGMVVRDSAGNPLGWTGGKSSSVVCNSLNNSECRNQVGEVYGFQTGIAIACLAKAGKILQNKKYLSIAKEVMSYWMGWRKKVTPCKQCEYFYASNALKESDRYVRNMNLFMAFGSEELGIATNDASLRQLARRTVQSDIVERASGNKGYLGMQDLLWAKRTHEYERIENHSAAMAVLLKSMGRSMKDKQVLQHAVTVWNDWATCSNDRCVHSGCKYWAGKAETCQDTVTASHCAFRDNMQPLAQAQCAIYIHNSKHLGGFALWAWSLGD